MEEQKALADRRADIERYRDQQRAEADADARRAQKKIRRRLEEEEALRDIATQLLEEMKDDADDMAKAKYKEAKRRLKAQTPASPAAIVILPPPPTFRAAELFGPQVLTEHQRGLLLLETQCKLAAAGCGISVVSGTEETAIGGSVGGAVVTGTSNGGGGGESSLRCLLMELTRNRPDAASSIDDITFLDEYTDEAAAGDADVDGRAAAADSFRAQKTVSSLVQYRYRAAAAAANGGSQPPPQLIGVQRVSSDPRGNKSTAVHHPSSSSAVADQIALMSRYLRMDAPIEDERRFERRLRKRNKKTEKKREKSDAREAKRLKRRLKKAEKRQRELDKAGSVQSGESKEVIKTKTKDKTKKKKKNDDKPSSSFNVATNASFNSALLLKDSTRVPSVEPKDDSDSSEYVYRYDIAKSLALGVSSEYGSAPHPQPLSDAPSGVLVCGDNTTRLDKEAAVHKQPQQVKSLPGEAADGGEGDAPVSANRSPAIIAFNTKSMNNKTTTPTKGSSNIRRARTAMTFDGAEDGNATPSLLDSPAVNSFPVLEKRLSHRRLRKARSARGRENLFAARDGATQDGGPIAPLTQHQQLLPPLYDLELLSEYGTDSDSSP